MAKHPMTEAERAEAQRLRKDVGQRLRVVREVLGLNQVEFGRRAGLAANTYNMIEGGTKLPSISVAIALCDAHGLTLDYIFRGDPSDLSAAVRRAIDALNVARVRGSSET